MGFKDHFSGHADDYSRYRPGYPAALYEYLIEHCAATDVAWDCATGNGQVARDLTHWFKQVIATDASAQQISNAPAQDGVEFRVATAEEPGIAENSLDLVTVGQALHWFDIPRFMRVAEQLLKSGGVFAAWTYHQNRITPEIDAVTFYLYEDMLGPYWPPERVFVESAYADIEMPFTKLPFPAAIMQEEWTLAEFLGYLNTWSAGKRFATDHGFNPVAELELRFEQAWGKAERKRNVYWPLHGRIGLKSK